MAIKQIETIDDYLKRGGKINTIKKQFNKTETVNPYISTLCELVAEMTEANKQISKCHSNRR